MNTNHKPWKPGSSENSVTQDNRDRLAELRYLESVIDCEGGIERGPLSGKEIFIYSPPKSGTVSLFHMVASFMRDERGWKDPQRRMLHNHQNAAIIENLEVPDHLKAEVRSKRAIMKDLIEYKRLIGGRARIISSFRDPLQRAISSLFDSLENSLNANPEATLKDISFEACYERLLAILERMLSTPHSLEEISSEFFQHHRFDRVKKFCYADEGHFDVLALSADHSAIWQSALEEQLGYVGISVFSSNVTATKKVGALYGEFKNNLRLPKELIERIYFGDHAQHNALAWFYDKTELNERYSNALELYGER